MKNTTLRKSPLLTLNYRLQSVFIPFIHSILVSNEEDGKMIQCCPPKSNNHPQCYPILIPPDDPFYGEWEEDCLNFVRTAMCSQCKLGKFLSPSFIHNSCKNKNDAILNE